MAKPSLKLDRLIDGDALRRHLAGLAAAGTGDGSGVAVRPAVLQALKESWACGRETAEAMLGEDGSGTACAARLSYLMDEIVRALYDFVVTHVYRMRNPSSGERM